MVLPWFGGGALLRSGPPAKDLAAGRVQAVKGDLAQCKSNPAMIAPANDAGRHASSVPGDRPLTVAHGRYLLFVWPAARLVPARAYDAVRCGGSDHLHMLPDPARITGRSCHLRRWPSSIEFGFRFAGRLAYAGARRRRERSVRVVREAAVRRLGRGVCGRLFWGPVGEIGGGVWLRAEADVISSRPKGPGWMALGLLVWVDLAAGRGR